jgi:hypothetical protein
MAKMTNDSQQATTVATASPELSESQIKSTLHRKDRFGDFTSCAMYEEVVDPETGEKQGWVHITNPYDDLPVVVSLRTQASREDVEKIISRISPVPEFTHMLTKMAECYDQGYPCYIEGGTAIGKTYMVNKFTELLYGRGVKPLDFYCSGQTDVSDLIGKWVPKEGADPEVKAKWEKFINSSQGKEKLQQIDEEIATTGKDFTTEQKIDMWQAQMRKLASDIGLHGAEADFTFQLGALPKAFMGEYKDGRFSVREGADGFILHVQEAGLAKPAVLNSLLRVRGEQGELADGIQLWEDGGRFVRRGPRGFVVFTNNPVDGYLDRKPIDPALTRGCEVVRFGEGLSETSVRMMSRQIFSYALGNNQNPTNKHATFDFRNTPEINESIGLAMIGIHQTLASHFNLGESDDPQKMPIVMDNMYKVAQYMQNLQVKQDNGQIDVGKTLMRAIRSTYLERARPEEREELRKLVEEQIFGDTGKQIFEGKLLSLSEKLNLLAGRSNQQVSPSANKAEEVVNESENDDFLDGLNNLLGNANKPT